MRRWLPVVGVQLVVVSGCGSDDGNDKDKADGDQSTADGGGSKSQKGGGTEDEDASSARSADETDSGSGSGDKVGLNLGDGADDPDDQTDGGDDDDSGQSDGSGSTSTGNGEPTEISASVYGESYSGQYHLGPVDFAESAWHNACAPAGGYRSELRSMSGLDGEFLAGVSNTHAQNGGVCDACIQITTETGRSIVARVVTYGATNEPGDIDVSPSVYEELDTGEWPRSMSWQFARCPDTGNLRYEFQTGANVYWTSFWVRNQRVPLTKVEVKSAKHGDFFELRRESDGTLNDDGGFGEGEFTLRLTGMDGQVVTDTFSGFSPGEVLESNQQFE